MRILYVDSVITDVESVHSALPWQITGIQLERADSLAAARLVLADAPHAAFDLWLVKFTLADGCGIALLNRARQAGLAVPVVMASDAAQQEEILAALREGAQDFLFWPDD
ncbi:MAG: response regulator, partial [Zoogloeaceae bacterium]|nr:response regulator [Zoogloeaceae bacterium]